MLPAKCCTLFQFVRAVVTVYLASRRLSFPRYWNNNNNNFHVCFVVCLPVCVCVCVFVLVSLLFPILLSHTHTQIQHTIPQRSRHRCCREGSCRLHRAAPFSAAPREFTYINQSHFALLHFMGRFFLPYWHRRVQTYRYLPIYPIRRDKRQQDEARRDEQQ